MTKSYFATKLVELLKKHKITTSMLSKATNISEITINKLRNGQNSNPTISTIKPIAEYFGVSIDYLINEQSIPQPKIITVIDIDNFNGTYKELNIDEFFIKADFGIRITNDNYQEYKKFSILLINKDATFNNDDIVLTNLNNSYVILKLIIEGNTYIGKSLTGSEKYYDLNIHENILGTLVGVIWKKS